MGRNATVIAVLRAWRRPGHKQVLRAALGIGTLGGAMTIPAAGNVATAQGTTSAQASPPVPTLVWEKTVPNGIIRFSSPNVANLDSSGPSVVVGAENGQVLAFHLSDGSPVAGWPVQTSHPVDSTPSAAPLAPAGLDEIFVGTGDYSTATSAGIHGGYLGYAPNGHQLWYQPGPWPGSSSGAVQASMAVGAVTSNGQPDVVAGELGQEIYALNAGTGSVLPGWPYPTADSVFSSPALIKLPGSATTDIVEGGDQTAGVGNGKVYQRGGTLRFLNGAGQELWRFRTTEVIDSSPVVGDMKANGQQEIVTGTGMYWADNGGASDSTKLFALSSSGQELWSADLGGDTFAAPALADLTGNGQLDAIEGTIGGASPGEVWAFDPSGHVLPGFPVDPAPGRFVDSQVATADLYGQGRQDILVPSALGVFAYDGQGHLLFNLAANHIVLQNTPLITHDSNGTLGITIAGQDVQNPNGSIVAHYELPGGALGNRGWPQFRHDPRLTANMVPPALSTVSGGCSQQLMSGAVVGSVPDATGKGYWIADRFGNVASCGDAPNLGSLTGRGFSNIRGIVGTPNKDGFYLFTTAGNVFNFGAGQWFGSIPAQGVRLPSPVVAMTSSGGGSGYDLATARGNVYNFGAAQWHGSLYSTTLPAPVSGIAASGSGYLMVTSLGNVYNFAAPWEGSLPSVHVVPSHPVVGVALDSTTGGYWLVGSNGSVYNFNAPFYGSAASQPQPSPIVSLSPVPGGYRLAVANGAVYDYGSAGFYGTAG